MYASSNYVYYFSPRIYFISKVILYFVSIILNSLNTVFYLDKSRSTFSLTSYYFTTLAGR